MRKMILFVGWFMLLAGFFGILRWLDNYIPGVNELTKDNVSSMFGLTLIAIHIATEDLK